MSTKEHILQVARELIYQQGYVATAISDILTAAGVGKGQLYHYFASKKAIGLTAVECLLTEWREVLLEDILKRDNPKQALRAMLDWFLNFHQGQEVYYGCPVGNLIVELAAQDKEFQAILAGFMEDWQASLAEVLGQAFPELSPAEQEQLALSLIASLQGASLLIKLHQDIHSLTTVRLSLLKQLGLLEEPASELLV